MLGAILIVVLILALLGVLPLRSHSQRVGIMPQAAARDWFSSLLSFFCFSDAFRHTRTRST